MDRWLRPLKRRVLTPQSRRRFTDGLHVWSCPATYDLGQISVEDIRSDSQIQFEGMLQ